ncbi:hypothetical protein [Dyadobacter sp. LHD-138]|uniref:hypothetical protein n=1 Tax=Dyadobacter sp. LHD-138 TaxID=3071413 RepID=UPI0027E01F7C|nr:hypothetical protein [Dyadobacter sp. LHD-138]MDQ6479542.1 hypothetical protein [Dyadobacter sp. LHD-138]
MKTFIGLRYNKSYVKKNGRSQLYILVGIDTDFDKIPLDVDWPPCLVDEENFQLLARDKNDTECNDNNLMIRQAYAKVNDIFMTARLQNIRIKGYVLQLSPAARLRAIYER